MKIGEYKLTQLLMHIANNVAQTKAYTNWSDDFSRRNSIEALETVQEKFDDIDFFAMTREELSELGFGSDDNGLMLIPLYLFDTVPDGTPLKSVGGRDVVKGDHLDLDVRFGCVAYGLFDEKWKKEEETK